MQSGESSIGILCQMVIGINEEFAGNDFLLQILDVPRLGEAIKEAKKIASQLLTSELVIQLLQVIINDYLQQRIQSVCSLDQCTSYDCCHFVVLVIERYATMGCSTGSYCDVYV
jgi:exoribonuclease II